MSLRTRLVAAAAGAFVAASLGGVGLAWAQEADPPTTTPTDPNAQITDDRPRDGKDCDHDGGGAGETDTSESPRPASGSDV